MYIKYIKTHMYNVHTCMLCIYFIKWVLYKGEKLYNTYFRIMLSI